MNPAIALASLVLALTALAACGAAPVVCTEEARSSVQVTIVDENGAPINDAIVTFQPAGGSLSDCEQLGEPNEFTCGFEVAGDLTIRASAASRAPVEQVVTVEADECHVITEQVTITLQPA